ncbi:MAG: penicillin-insensitive murein endopeptidase [Candidatus Accumulibacter sp.]|uniref:carboxypeptidase-like regulatory domain-containing protein n=1 Tax=Accumulibacter sp. TaxID=2053492 RepID=UPI001AC56EC7|nr:carboxypeptidase-like regulatory domain-containing protein [Accumulibacter sp.]MBN8439818.1 penicillin-insensitive murein endopeptidase [Accumulibacter sp.]
MKWSNRILLLCAALILVESLTACGGGGGSGNESTPPQPPVASTPPPVASTDPDPHEQEPTLSAMTLSHVRTSDALQAQGSPLKLKATGAALSSDLSLYTVYLNGDLLDDSALSITGDELSVNSTLTDGKNKVLVFAPDGAGARVEGEAVVWAGASAVQGRVVDETGNPVSGATVVAALGDDSTVTATTTTNASGHYVLNNFPARTVLVQVTGTNGLLGSTASVAGSAFPDVVLLGFGTPVASLNNDFLAGTSGWINHNGASLTLVDHVDNPGPAAASSSLQKVSALFMRWLPLSTAHAQAPPTKDLRVGTSGKGPRTVTYTFRPPADTKTARIRYRFQTQEYPTYFGTKYNDSFNVALRTNSGKSAVVAGAMNELGSAAFASGGSTAWKELTVELATAGEPVQVDLTVANVGDGVVDSAVIVNFVSTSPLSIPQASLFDIDNSSLKYLSAASHTYFNSTTRVHATFKVTGPDSAKLSSLELQVLQAGAVKARGTLTTSLSSSVYTAFGTSGIKLTGAQLAFEIPASELASVSTATDGPLTLKLVAKADDGRSVEKDMGSVQLLDHWTGTDRYGGRDDNRGGDDWLTAVTREVCKAVTVKWGDFSNMNAGSFATDHSSHTKGIDVDGWYAGYNARDAAAATKMIALLNTAGVGNKVKIVYVTHTAIAGNAFYDAYKDVTLADGRKAKKVIQNWGGHESHFHWNVQ